MLQYQNLMRSFNLLLYWVSIELTECREGMNDASLIEMKSIVQDTPSSIHFLYSPMYQGSSLAGSVIRGRYCYGNSILPHHTDSSAPSSSHLLPSNHPIPFTPMSCPKLHKYVHSKIYPTSMNSIKGPSIQFSHAFINALADDSICGSYNLTPRATNTVFKLAVEKDEVLKQWVSKKDKEVKFLEGKVSVASAVTQLEVCEKKHQQLKAHYDYLQDSPVYEQCYP